VIRDQSRVQARVVIAATTPRNALCVNADGGIRFFELGDEAVGRCFWVIEVIPPTNRRGLFGKAYSRWVSPIAVAAPAAFSRVRLFIPLSPSKSTRTELLSVGIFRERPSLSLA
jgi:hypothetical protein